MKSVVLLGSTGSIGGAAVEILTDARDGLTVTGLVAGRNIDELEGQLNAFPDALFAMGDEKSLDAICARKNSFRKRATGFGQDAIVELISRTKPDIVLNALVGISGLVPTMAALERGCTVALANKETLVTAGELLEDTIRNNAGAVIPVDSEHFSLSRCLRGYGEEVEEIILTASGGPFLAHALEELRNVTVEDVLAHPTWNMGKKITVDSAHLLNKGLEVIEAHWLFSFPYDKIKVVIHPQSVVHAVIRLRDGSMLAHIGPADMRLPVMNALFHPEIREFPWKSLSLEELDGLNFFALQEKRFPAYNLALEAARTGGIAPAVLNAADEAAVEAFLAGKIRFLDIIDWIADALSAHSPGPIGSVGDILEADAWTREYLASKHG